MERRHIDFNNTVRLMLMLIFITVVTLSSLFLDLPGTSHAGMVAARGRFAGGSLSSSLFVPSLRRPSTVALSMMMRCCSSKSLRQLPCGSIRRLTPTPPSRTPWITMLSAPIENEQLWKHILKHRFKKHLNRVNKYEIFIIVKRYSCV